MATVLVIDDDPAVQRLVARWLEVDHTVEMMTAAAAIEAITEGRRFDAIVCDLNMPKMSGVDVHTAIGRVDAEQARRILFMSGAVSHQTHLEGVPGPVLPKPLDRQALLTLVAGFLPIRLSPSRS